MKLDPLQSILLNSASLLIPVDQRDAWLEEWHSELWYMRHDVALAACLGAFRDAFWLRRNAAPSRTPLVRSPWKCLAVLSAVAIFGLLMADWLIAPLAARASLWKLARRDLIPACVLTLLVSVGLLPLWGLAASNAEARHHLPKRGRMRRTLFLAAKLIAVQPILVCGMFVCVMVASLVPLAPLGALGIWCLTLRWVIADQRNRCPECLHLLESAIRVGTASSTFLDCHVAEAACPRGHGLLHSPESGVSYTSAARWLHLDPSWKQVFLRLGTRL